MTNCCSSCGIFLDFEDFKAAVLEDTKRRLASIAAQDYANWIHKKMESAIRCGHREEILRRLEYLRQTYDVTRFWRESMVRYPV